MSESEDLWSKFDRRLAELKASEANRKLDRSFLKSLRALSTTCGTLGDHADSVEALDLCFNLINRLVGKAYGKYLKVWKLQGNNDSPEFERLRSWKRERTVSLL